MGHVTTSLPWYYAICHYLSERDEKRNASINAAQLASFETIVFSPNYAKMQDLFISCCLVRMFAEY